MNNIEKILENLRLMDANENGDSFIMLKKSDFIEFHHSIDNWIGDVSRVHLVRAYNDKGIGIGFLAWYEFDTQFTHEGEEINVSGEVTLSTVRDSLAPRLFKTLDSAFNTFCDDFDRLTLVTEG